MCKSKIQNFIFEHKWLIFPEMVTCVHFSGIFNHLWRPNLSWGTKGNQLNPTIMLLVMQWMKLPKFLDTNTYTHTHDRANKDEIIFRTAYSSLSFHWLTKGGTWSIAHAHLWNILSQSSVTDRITFFDHWFMIERKRWVFFFRKLSKKINFTVLKIYNKECIKLSSIHIINISFINKQCTKIQCGDHKSNL